jgi:hypothetical protein
MVRLALAAAAIAAAFLAVAAPAGAQTVSCEGPLRLAAHYWTGSECRIGWTCQSVSGCRWRPISGASLAWVEPGHIGNAKGQSRWTLVDKNPLNGYRPPVSFGQACTAVGGNYTTCETTQALMVAHKGDQVNGTCWAPATLALTRYFAAYVRCQLITQ